MVVLVENVFTNSARRRDYIATTGDILGFFAGFQVSLFGFDGFGGVADGNNCGETYGHDYAGET